MARPSKHGSPTLNLAITQEHHTRASQSNSGGCLIADAIKEQYPNLSGVVVDMATIRVTDRERGMRYVYLTPPAAQHVLLSFDQGWPNPFEQLVVRRAVQVHAITRAKTGADSAAGVRQSRAERIEALEAKEASGESLNRYERATLTRARNAPPPVERPSSAGPADVKVATGGSQHGAVIAGGRPIPQGPDHTNLLRGRDRHFGARLADPGQAFREAVEAAVAERLSPPVPQPVAGTFDLDAS